MLSFLYLTLAKTHIHAGTQANLIYLHYTLREQLSNTKVLKNAVYVSAAIYYVDM